MRRIKAAGERLDDRMTMRMKILIAATALAALSACSKPAATPPAATGGPVAHASIQEVMVSVVEPASAIVWKTPDSFDPAKKATQAQIDADWLALRKGAVALSEASNLIVMEGRHAAPPGVKLQNEGLEGNLTTAQIDEKLKTDRTKLLEYAKALQDASLKVLVAIDAKKPDAVLEAGGAVDEACEACHKHFWYPGAPTPP